MSKKGKAAVGVTVAAALAVTVGAGAAVAADMGYAPTTLGNSAYTNQVDVRNDYTVQAMRYTSCISNQNADSVDNAEGLSVKLGDASDDVSPNVLTNTGERTSRSARSILPTSPRTRATRLPRRWPTSSPPVGRSSTPMANARIPTHRAKPSACRRITC